MKTAISIPDELFEGADKLAEKMGVSRSKLYVSAIKSYLEAHEDGAVIDKLNDVYGKVDSRLDPGVKKLQARSISGNQW